MLNIIGGNKKRTKLNVPDSYVRPTSSKKREAIFAILESKGLKNDNNIYANKYFLDLFAGTGALGLEAISRGAKFCYFYEISNDVLKVLINNCNKVCENDNFAIIQQDITKSLFQEINHPPSVIFIDPPYSLISFNSILSHLLKSKLIIDQTSIVIESSSKTKIDHPSSLKIFDIKIYGKTKISFLEINSD